MTPRYARALVLLPAVAVLALFTIKAVGYPVTAPAPVTWSVYGEGSSLALDSGVPLLDAGQGDAGWQYLDGGPIPCDGGYVDSGVFWTIGDGGPVNDIPYDGGCTWTPGDGGPAAGCYYDAGPQFGLQDGGPCELTYDAGAVCVVGDGGPGHVTYDAGPTTWTMCLFPPYRTLDGGWLTFQLPLYDGGPAFYSDPVLVAPSTTIFAQCNIVSSGGVGSVDIQTSADGVNWIDWPNTVIVEDAGSTSIAWALVYPGPNARIAQTPGNQDGGALTCYILPKGL